MNHIAIAGAGVLGAQIAYQCAFHGRTVVLHDLTQPVLDRAHTALARLAAVFQREMSAPPAACEAALGRIRLTTDLGAALQAADLLIEAIPEVLETKKAFYREAAGLAPARTVFATNSSTLLPSRLAPATGRPERFLALHFANEIWTRNTAEIMGHAQTDPAVFQQVVDFAHAIGMVALPLHREHPGYITNSLLIPWINAAMRLWAEGVADPETIDRTWMIGVKTQFVPFAFADMVGLQTAYNITVAMAEQQDDDALRTVARRLKEEFINRGKLGVSTGEGFYRYPDPDDAQPGFAQRRERSAS